RGVGGGGAGVARRGAGGVGVDARLEVRRVLADVGVLEPQAGVGAFELAAVHAAGGIARLAVTDADPQLQQGVRIGGPAEGDVGIPLLPGRADGVAVAIAVVVGLGAVGADARIAQAVAVGGIDDLVVAAEAAGQQAAAGFDGRRFVHLAVALEAHRTGRGARAPQHRLRPLGDHQAVVVLRRDVGHRVVHAAGAGARHRAVIGQQVEPRAEHAAQHRVAVGAAVAHRREAGNGLEVVRAIAGRYRLARQLGAGV